MGGLTRPDKAQQAPSISAVFSAFQDGFDRSLQFFSFPPCSIFSDNARGALSLSQSEEMPLPSIFDTSKVESAIVRTRNFLTVVRFTAVLSATCTHLNAHCKYAFFLPRRDSFFLFFARTWLEGALRKT